MSEAVLQTAMPSVLVIEDNVFMSRLYRSLFASLSCRLLQASSVAEAMILLEEPSLALLIVDLRLPDGSGLAVIEAVRARPALREIPIVVISTRPRSAAEADVLRAGANHFLAKPVDVDELRMLAARLLSTASVIA